MERFAELSRRAVIGFAVASLVVFALWGTYHLLDDEWDPVSYGGRDYSCAGPRTAAAPKSAHRLPGTMNGNPVYVERLPVGDYSPTVLHVRVGKSWRVCGLHGGP